MISIFALDSYIGHSYSKNSPVSVRRLSSRIRGEEIAEYLGAKYNPTEGYENDVRIYVKPRTLNEISDGSYVDFLDGEFRDYWLIKRPKIKVIAASLYSYEYMKKRVPNEIFLIPSHHLNVDRLRRDRKEIKVCGYIGAPSPAAFRRFDEIEDRLKDMGMEMVMSWFFKIKQDALDLYKQIDIFICGDWDGYDHPFKIPTKIVNAASFGIPCVAYPMMANQELEGYYLPARSLKETLEEVEKLRDGDYYTQLVEKIVPFAENYHISNIALKYRKLV
jgi:hypothetical protein